jgi:hypothetical protein
MSMIILTPANDDERPEPGVDVVTTHLAARRIERRLMTVVAGLAVVAIMVTLAHVATMKSLVPDLAAFVIRG